MKRLSFLFCLEALRIVTTTTVQCEFFKFHFQNPIEFSIKQTELDFKDGSENEFSEPGGHFIAALGDFNSNRHTDFFLINEKRDTVSVYTNQKHKDNNKSSPIHTQRPLIKLESGRKIVNIIPSDFNYDGQLDLLITFSEHSDSSGPYFNRVYLGKRDAFETQHIDLPSSKGQPTLVSYFGDMKTNLFGEFSEEANKWALGIVSLNDHSDKTRGYTLKTDVLPNSDGLTAGSLNPHYSSAFTDLNGDCVPDLIFSHSKYVKANGEQQAPASGAFHLEILINGPDGFSVGKRQALPVNPIIPISLCDIDGDGSMDIVYATSDALHILYNKQKHYCNSVKEKNQKSDICKDRTVLCVADPDYGFETEKDPKSYYVKVPFSRIFGKEFPGLKTLCKETGQPITLRFGDYNLDGFPDILLITSDNHAHVLTNCPCTLGENGEHAVQNSYRSFCLNEGVEEYLKAVPHVCFGTFFDFDKHGSLDILLNVHEKGVFKVISIVNKYSDGFFFRVSTLTPACSIASGKYSSNFPGAFYKYSFVDTSSIRRVSSKSQYHQCTYMSLMNPREFIGLGTSNTFIEVLEIGIPRHSPGSNMTTWTNIMPNCNLYVFPTDESPTFWSLDQYIEQTNSTLWIKIFIFIALVVLSFVIFFLKKAEIEEDRREKQKTRHIINFNAL